MVRKAVIVGLTLASVVTVVLTPLTCSDTHWLAWESATTTDSRSGPDWAVRLGSRRVWFGTKEYFATRRPESSKEWAVPALGF